MKGNRIVRAAGLLVIFTLLFSCSKKSTGPSGPGTPTTIGTWALTMVRTIVGPDTTHSPVAAASSIRYIQVSGTTVVLYLYDTPPPQAWVGTYDPDQQRFTFAQDVFTIALSSDAMVLVSASDNTVLYTFTRYSGDVPPAAWPANLTVEDDRYEPDDDITTATALTAGGTPQFHTLDNNDQDWYSLQLTAGYIYVITTTLDMQGSFASFYSAAGQPLDLDNEVEVNEDNGTVTIMPLTTRTVYLQVRTQNGTVYTMSLRSSPVNPSPYTGAWYAASGQVSYREGTSQGTEETTYTIQTTPFILELFPYSVVIHQFIRGRYESDTVRIVYVNSSTVILDGDTLSFTQSGNQIQVYFEKTDGTDYYQETITLLPYYGQIPPAAWTTGPDVPSSATPLTVNASPVNSSLARGEQEWYYFTAAAGAAYQVETGGSLVDTYMTLYRLNGSSLVMVASDDDGGTEANARIVFSADAGGTYYVLVEGYDDMETGYYTISVATGGILKTAGAPQGMPW